MFSGIDDRDKLVMHIEKYSPKTNTLDVISQMYDYRTNFSACSFIEDIYVFGGFLSNYTNSCLLEDETSSCLVFNTMSNTWNKIACMNVARQNASCTVFEGRIVVTGGYNNNDGVLNTVVAYDHIGNSWTNMPNMKERRSFHKSVAIKNKLFVINRFSSQTIEVFDSYSKKFALLHHPFINLYSYYIADVTSIGNKIVLFSNRDGSIFLYDVEKDMWSEKSCDATKNILDFSCASLTQ